MKNFKKLIVWQRSMQLASEITTVVSHLPTEDRFTYRDQIIRASISIPSNIAEGCSRDSGNDMRRFLRISLGSSFELETQLLLLKQNGIIRESELGPALSFNTEVQKMLQSLLKKNLNP